MAQSQREEAVVRMWVLIVVGWWLGFDHGPRRREWWWVLTSRGQGREGQQGRMLRKGQVQIGSQKDKFGLGAS